MGGGRRITASERQECEPRPAISASLHCRGALESRDGPNFPPGRQGRRRRRGNTHVRGGRGVGGAEDARRGGGVKSWGTPTGKSPDYFTDCRRGLRYRERAAAVVAAVAAAVRVSRRVPPTLTVLYTVETQ